MMLTTTNVRRHPVNDVLLVSKECERATRKQLASIPTMTATRESGSMDKVTAKHVKPSA